ncbi:MAG: YraN family protein [Clostridiales bacterium]|nr:MAG: YraN family protein [Clostridiales bacterium]
MANKVTNIGYEIEEKVANLLKKDGNKILARNYKSKYGEIDIVYREKASKTIVFVEVKYRKNSDYGKPYEFVNKKKFERIMKTVHIFLMENKLSHNIAMRFDVISVLSNGEIKHFKSVNDYDLY